MCAAPLDLDTYEFKRRILWALRTQHAMGSEGEDHLSALQLNREKGETAIVTGPELFCSPAGTFGRYPNYGGKEC